MLSLLYDFFINLFYYGYPQLEHTEELDTALGSSIGVNVCGTIIPFDSVASYFALIASFISLIVILCLCCMFIVTIIKLVGGLFRR